MNIAHKHPDSGEEEPLYTAGRIIGGLKGHLDLVSELAEQFASAVSCYSTEEWEKWGRFVGLWHDLGKYSREFQKYIRHEIHGRYDHSTAGAVHAINRFSCAGDLMAYALAGHHGGLPNGTDFFGERISKKLPEWEKYAPEELLNKGTGKLSPLIRPIERTNNELGFGFSMQVRMLFSCLVDADFLATEAFMSPDQSRQRARWPQDTLSRMSGILEDYLTDKEKNASSEQNASHKIVTLRARIHERCFDQGEKLPRGLYRLNVPTGGGKTLASLSFALKHACVHGLKRVIYVIPYTSIIDQTADEFRKVFSDLSAELGEECVLAHHSMLEPEQDTDSVRLVSENWDAPVIVTTSVQLFESLFANKPSRCRKIHRCGNAVLIFDEAQTLPSHLLAPCLEAIKCLNRDYGSTLVLCTATQPAFEQNDHFPIGWKPEIVQSLLGKEMEDELRAKMRRVQVTRLSNELSCNDLIAHYNEVSAKQSVMMIVNTTHHAQTLFKGMQKHVGEEELFHLSARMVPKHRKSVLRAIRDRLTLKKKVVLVATRVVEAGVDLSFPIVYRDQSGLDSLAQAAGRCNRHGEFSKGGMVYSFVSSDFPINAKMHDLIAAASATRDVWLNEEDIFDDQHVSSFFRLYYDNRRIQTNDWGKNSFFPKCQVNLSRRDGFRALQFEKLADDFHIIPPGQREIVLAFDKEGEHIIKQLKAIEQFSQKHCFPGHKLRKELAQYSIRVYDYEYKLLQQEKILEYYADDSISVVTDMKNVYDMNVGFLPMKDYDLLHANYIS